MIGEGNGVLRGTPRVGLGPWVGARVASQHCPILRPGRLQNSAGAPIRPGRQSESSAILLAIGPSDEIFSWNEP